MVEFNRGSTWRIWDLQVQTILDDNYTSLSEYYLEVKKESPELWDNFVGKVGGEENALRFDSKAYFTDNSIPVKERCVNYSRTLFEFVEVFNPGVGLTESKVLRAK
jgi:hypothetical protein